jgi:hypothetical protein
MENLTSILRTKLICSSISLVACTFTITLYISLVIKTYCFQKIRKRDSINLSTPHTSFIEGSDSLLNSFHLNRTFNKKSGRKKKVRLGLGSHFVFFLSLSYLLYYISFFSYMVKEPSKDDPRCGFQAFLMNFFDMSAISWTACIGRVTILGTKMVDIKKVNRSMFLFFLYSFFPSFSLSFG